jgi:hypothetical protein
MSAEEVIDLVRQVLPDGSEIFQEPGDATRAPVQDVAVRPDGVITLGPKDEDAQIPLSTVPSERMAGDVPSDWAVIADQLRRKEQGLPSRDVVIRPGGTVELSRPGETPTQASRLPQEVMAAAAPVPNLAEAAEVIRQDPRRIEAWEPVVTSVLSGWKFRLQPIPGDQVFTFLAFRNPSEGNLYRLWVLNPNMDDPRWFGHKNHMVSVTVGGERIPVICGPGGRAAPDLAAARAYATKWSLYTLRLMRGEKACFSE